MKRIFALEFINKSALNVNHIMCVAFLFPFGLHQKSAIICSQRRHRSFGCVDVPRACGGIRRTSKFNELFRGFNSFKCDSLCKFNQHCFHTESITSIFWFTLFLLLFVTHNFILIRHTNVCIHALLYTAR